MIKTVVFMFLGMIYQNIYSLELTGKIEKDFILSYSEKDETNGLLFTSIIKNIDDTFAVEEKGLTKNSEFVSYDFIQHQIKAKAFISRVNDKINFSYTINGKTKTNIEKYSENFVVGPSIFTYIRKYQNELLNGIVKKIRYGVSYRVASYEFNLLKISEEKNIYVIKMEGGNFFIRKFVDPIFFKFQKTDKDFNLLSIEGRQLPLKYINDKFTHFDGILSFNYKN